MTTWSGVLLIAAMTFVLCQLLLPLARAANSAGTGIGNGQNAQTYLHSLDWWAVGVGVLVTSILVTGIVFSSRRRGLGALRDQQARGTSDCEASYDGGSFPTAAELAPLFDDTIRGAMYDTLGELQDVLSTVRLRLDDSEFFQPGRYPKLAKRGGQPQCPRRVPGQFDLWREDLFSGKGAACFGQGEYQPARPMEALLLELEYRLGQLEALPSTAVAIIDENPTFRADWASRRYLAFLNPPWYQDSRTLIPDERWLDNSDRCAGLGGNMHFAPYVQILPLGHVLASASAGISHLEQLTTGHDTLLKPDAEAT